MKFQVIDELAESWSLKNKLGKFIHISKRFPHYITLQFSKKVIWSVAPWNIKGFPDSYSKFLEFAKSKGWDI